MQHCSINACSPSCPCKSCLISWPLYRRKFHEFFHFLSYYLTCSVRDRTNQAVLALHPETSIKVFMFPLVFKLIAISQASLCRHVSIIYLLLLLFLLKIFSFGCRTAQFLGFNVDFSGCFLIIPSQSSYSA